MAQWSVSDELDARLRDRLGGGDPSAYVQRIIADQLDFEDDPAFQAEALAKIKKGMAEIDNGDGVDGPETTQQVADEFGIKRHR